jgi:hypothetical protein
MQRHSEESRQEVGDDVIIIIIRESRIVLHNTQVTPNYFKRKNMIRLN